MTNIELRTLAPEYIDAHHKTYVSRLSAAVVDPRNKNIALTGRYGSGKSSILDRFIDEQGKSKVPAQGLAKWVKRARAKVILRISINTLGPNEDEDLTNRIQKELVKQLVYRTKPGELRTSRFARERKLTWWRTGIEALVVAAVVVGSLWLVGVRPNEDAFGTDSYLLPMLALFLLAFLTLWRLRWFMGSRTVSQFSTGGASIEFEQKTDSFFDKYLDELVVFFETTEPDIVVFEDLDRFDDPQIFDSLRELNTLINTSAHWQRRSNRPLRFVYAIKDSLFEKLGDDQHDKDAAGKQKNDEGDTPTPGTPVPAPMNNGESVAAPGAKRKDIAAEAVERANRTKFFEIVIPVVPFLSHSNARDLFLEELKNLDLPEDAVIDRGLIDIVARHTTDMRLMINIGNEFVVYAERLLWAEGAKPAPGITADRLFALVVYKNFHLADFEALPNRGSALDTLEQARRNLVTTSIGDLQQERALIRNGATRRNQQRDWVIALDHRLAVLLESTGTTLHSAKVGNTPLDLNTVSRLALWRTIGQSGAVEMVFHHLSGHNTTAIIDNSDLKALFPEVADSDGWADSPRADAARTAEIDKEIAELRGASFERLVEVGRYRHEGRTFRTVIDDTLPSQLARDLVKRGYIDRFYAEYSTVFYGDFLGVDVANFFRNSVWPNEMDVQFSFTTTGGVANVLAQAPAGFLQTRSALNIEVVDHLMYANKDSSSDLIDFLTQTNNTDGWQFLKIYFNTPGSRGEELASLLAAKPWCRLFSFIATAGTIDADDTNLRLLNAALSRARAADAFQFDDDARALLARLHAQIPAFQETPPGASTETLFAFLKEALPSIPKLRVLSQELQRLAVSAKQYWLSADNLRAAASLTDADPVSADSLVSKEAVWEYCVEHIDDYLELVASDEHTTSSCWSPKVLAGVINAHYEDWSSEQMEAFLVASAESATLPDITEIEEDAWELVVKALRVAPNVANLGAYVSAIGVDDALAGLLIDDSRDTVSILGVEDTTEEQLEILIPTLLNANEALTPSQRVLLTAQLLTSPESASLDLSEITATPDELLAELLRMELVDDSEETFVHFSVAGWSSIGPALRVSKVAATFLTSALSRGHAEEVVLDDSFPDTTRRAVLERLTEFAPTEGPTFRAAAAPAARKLGVRLSPEALMLIAPAVHDPEDVVWQLREHGSSIPAPTVVQILGRMPGDFAGFAGPPKQKFEVSDTPSLEAVLDRLKDVGEIVRQPGRQPRGRWKLRIA